MSCRIANFENATKFFKACEVGKGWLECKEWCTDDATFSCQADALKDVSTVEAYTNWMAGLLKDVYPKGEYSLKYSGYEDNNNSAVYYATFHRDGLKVEGPRSDYVYILTFNENGKINTMRKVWNDTWCLREFA